MGTLLEQQASLSDFLEFQRELQDLLIASNLSSRSPWGNPQRLARQIETYSNEFAMQVGRGKSFEDALDARSDFSFPVRLSWNAWLATQRSPESFELLQPPFAKIPGTRRTWFLPLQLAILLVLAFLILIVWSAWGARALLFVYRDSHLQPGILVRWMKQISDLPFGLWIGILALAFLAIFFLFRWIQRREGARWNERSSEVIAITKWQKGKFIELLTSRNHTIESATDLLRSIEKAPSAAETVSEEPVSSGLIHKNWLAVWGADWAFEKRMTFKVSSAPYMVFLAMSGLIVFGVGLAVFGPMIELLYALLPAGAF
jgi:hypothetical protein